MELMELESMFCIGNYQYVINEATNPQLLSHLSKEQVLKAKVLLHRAYLAHGRYNLVIQEIQPNDPDALIAIQLLAMYLASSEARPDIIAQLRVIATQAAPNPCLSIVLATTFMLHGDYHKALELVTMFDRDLECCLMQVQLLCLICRPDLARNQLMALKGISIDSVMTQLAEQWIGMFTGEPGKYEDAYYAFEELITANKATYKLLASKGVCLLHSGRYEEAYTLLTDALTHNPSNTDTIANLVVSSIYLNKKDTEQEYLDRLQELDPSHPLLRTKREKADIFDKTAQFYL